MKIASCIAFILMLIAYLWVDGSRLTYGLKIVSEYVFLAAVILFMLYKPELKPSERRFFGYVVGVVLSLGIYTFVCIYANPEWVKKNTIIFNILLSGSLPLIIIYDKWKKDNQQ